MKATSKVALWAGVLMPEGLPPVSANRIMAGEWREFPPGMLDEPGTGRLPVMFGRALLAATIAYEQRSAVPLALAANTLRIIDEDGVPVSQLHLRSGTPPETAASQSKALEHLAFAEIVTDSRRRGKLLRLTSDGARAQAAHAPTMKKVEAAVDAGGIAASKMRALLSQSYDGDLGIRAALTPPPGVRRSGTPWALGTDSPSVRARDREVVAQTEAF